MILFIAANKAYIGQSINIKRRWVDHRTRLKHNKCLGNPYLQNMYNKYGLAGMKFIVLENCLKEELSAREAHWILQIDQELRLNLAGVGEFPEAKEVTIAKTSSNIGKKRSEETKKRISEALKGKTKSQEHREKLSRASKEASSRLEVKKRMAEAQLGKKHSEETRKKISEAGKGRVQSEETKKKRAESMKRFYSSKKESIMKGGEKE